MVIPAGRHIGVVVVEAAGNHHSLAEESDLDIRCRMAVDCSIKDVRRSRSTHEANKDGTARIISVLVLRLLRLLLLRRRRAVATTTVVTWVSRHFRI